MRRLTYSVVLGLLCATSVAVTAAEPAGQERMPKRLLVDDWPNAFNRTGAIELHQSASAAAFSPDGTTFVTCPTDSAELIFWKTETAQIDRRITINARPFEGLKFSRNGKFLVIRVARPTENKTGAGVVIWDVMAQRIAWKLIVADDESGYSAFLAIDDSPDGRYLAVGDGHGRVHVWDFTDGKVARTLTAGQGRLHQVVFSAGGSRLLSNTIDSDVTLWDPANGRRIATRKFEQEAQWIGFLPDGTATVGVAANSILPRFIDVATGVTLPSAGNRDSFLAHFVIPGRARQATQMWPIRQEAISADGKLALVTVAGRSFGALVIMPDDPEQSISLAGAGFATGQQGFTMDGHWAYSVFTDDTTKGPNEVLYSLAFWEATSGKPGARVQPPGGLSSVVWSDDGRHALLLGEKRTWLWRNMAVPVR